MFDQFAKLDELGKTLVSFMDKVNVDLELIKTNQAKILNYLRTLEAKENE